MAERTPALTGADTGYFLPEPRSLLPLSLSRSPPLERLSPPREKSPLSVAWSRASCQARETSLVDEPVSLAASLFSYLDILCLQFYLRRFFRLTKCHPFRFPTYNYSTKKKVSFYLEIRILEKLVFRKLSEFLWPFFPRSIFLLVDSLFWLIGYGFLCCLLLF